MRPCLLVLLLLADLNRLCSIIRRVRIVVNAMLVGTQNKQDLPQKHIEPVVAFWNVNVCGVWLGASWHPVSVIWIHAAFENMFLVAITHMHMYRGHQYVVWICQHLPLSGLVWKSVDGNYQSIPYMPSICITVNIIFLQFQVLCPNMLNAAYLQPAVVPEIRGFFQQTATGLDRLVCFRNIAIHVCPLSVIMWCGISHLSQLMQQFFPLVLVIAWHIASE